MKMKKKRRRRRRRRRMRMRRMGKVGCALPGGQGGSVGPRGALAESGGLCGLRGCGGVWGALGVWGFFGEGLGRFRGFLGRGLGQFGGLFQGAGGVSGGLGVLPWGRGVWGVQGCPWGSPRCPNPPLQRSPPASAGSARRTWPRAGPCSYGEWRAGGPQTPGRGAPGTPLSPPPPPRNLSFDTEEEELEETLQRFGGVCYVRLVLHPHTGTPKGSAFAQFETPEGAQKCIEAAQEGPEGGGLRVGGRLLRVDPALSRDQARGLQGTSGGARPRTGTRNLYLAREGAIRPGSRAAEGVSDSDMAKRARFEELKRRRLQDPNVGVSRTRLCLHNLPKALDSARLRALLRGLLRAPGATAPLIKECRVMRELRGQGRSLGFAFVEFGEHEEALGALRRLNNNPELFGAHKLKAKAKAAAGPPDPPQAPPAPPQGRPDPPAGSGGTQDPSRPPPGTPPGAPWAGFRTQSPGQGGAPGAPRPKVLALPSHRGPKIRKRDKGKAQPPPKPPKAPKASRRREKLRAPPPQSQRRRRGGPGGAEARFQELVERYKRKILGSNPPTARGGKWFES
uniref:RNA binding motif protein 28 n=1 Tax=Corvus moneduloides TaxID=1196302 RepID=A0A8U7NDK9_CORMO